MRLEILTYMRYADRFRFECRSNEIHIYLFFLQLNCGVFRRNLNILQKLEINAQTHKYTTYFDQSGANVYERHHNIKGEMKSVRNVAFYLSIHLKQSNDAWHYELNHMVCVF